MGTVKNAEMKSGKKAEASYNRFFVNAFTTQDVDQIVDEGGADSKENFKKVSEDNVKDKGYWDAMFNNKFKGKDGKIRTSKFNRLGDAVYSKYFKQLQSRNIQIREYSRVGKEKTFYVVRRTVAKGQSITINNKLYRGGQFLPSKLK